MVFSISAIPGAQNKVVDSMAFAAISFQPLPCFTQSQYSVEVIFQPFVSDNIRSQQVFEDERKIYSFLNCINEFSSHLHDEEQEGDPPRVQLKTNRIPKGLVPLEHLFDKSDFYKGTK